MSNESFNPYQPPKSELNQPPKSELMHEPIEQKLVGRKRNLEAKQESMPQLRQAEENFANFLETYQKLICIRPQDRGLEGQENFHQMLADLSNDKLTITYSFNENIEGHFVLRDNETGDILKFRPFGRSTATNHTYLLTAKGGERLFLMKEARGEIVTQTLCRIQGGKTPTSIENDGIGVIFQTGEDLKREEEAYNSYRELSDELENTRSNIIKRLLNIVKIRELNTKLQDYPNPHDAYLNDRKGLFTKEVIPTAESEAIFEKFNRIVVAATESLRKNSVKH